MSRLIPVATAGRRGYTLIELLFTMTLLGMVGAALISLLTQQQRFYRDASNTVNVRRELRGAASLLPTEVRAISSRGGDVLEMNPTSFAFRANIGSSIICDRSPATPATFLLPPQNLKAGNTLTSWYSTPTAGDALFVFDEGTETGAEDDGWFATTVVSIVPSTSGCHPSPYTHPSDDSPGVKPRWLVTVLPALPSTVRVGAGVRFGRDVRYQLFQPAGSPRWYVGYQQRVSGTWSDLEPVGGPLIGGGTGSGQGLSFQYYDTLGAVATMATNTALSRVDVGLRAVAASGRALGQQATFSDSLLFRIGIRNFR
ncbi:MAG: PilW family protein [Gemmatimonadaceae bacterium]